MNRPFLAIAFFAAASVALGAQQASQSNPYEGVSTPPPDDTIITSTPPEAKPPAGHPANTQTTTPAQAPAKQAPVVNPADANLAPVDHANLAAANGDGTDDGIVEVGQPTASSVRPALSQRPMCLIRTVTLCIPPAGPGRVGRGDHHSRQLLSDLSSSLRREGEEFRSRVATDVMQGGQVLIPAGAEIDGVVAEA